MPVTALEKAVTGRGKEISMPEVRTIRFRCAKEGTPFYVEFARQSPRQRFTISSYSHFPTPLTRREGVFAAPVSAEQSFDINEFDMSGWTCLCCGHNVQECLFIQCGQCKELICGSHVRARRNGVLEFHCHAECGNSGTIANTLASLSGTDQLTEREPSPRTIEAGPRRELPTIRLYDR